MVAIYRTHTCCYCCLAGASHCVSSGLEWWAAMDDVVGLGRRPGERRGHGAKKKTVPSWDLEKKNGRRGRKIRKKCLNEEFVRLRGYSRISWQMTTHTIACTYACLPDPRCGPGAEAGLNTGRAQSLHPIKEVEGDTLKSHV